MDFNEYMFGISVKPQSPKQKGGRENKEKASNNNSYNMEEHMLEEHAYPNQDQEDFQKAIYVKRDFYIHKIPERGKIADENRVEEFRKKCRPDTNFRLSDTQMLLSNFINPRTPYKGVLIYHGTGVGKTCAAVAIAEGFKEMVEKYGVRITVLVPGPFNRQGFLGEIIKCTGEAYDKMYYDKTGYITDAEKAKNRKLAINIINQYYRLMSYASFYKKVLGEKIKEKVVSGDKVKMVNRRTDTGEYERDVSVDRIYSLDNSLIIADEAHNLTNNERGKAFKQIIEKSKNLRVVLLSATPMKNLADDIIELINFLRPEDAPMVRDKVFNNQHGHLMDFKPGGVEYFRNMVRGYVSYLRGADPLTFAKRIDVGVIPPGLSFTKVTRCYMLPFQLDVYKKVVDITDDSLDRRSEAVANFVFPGIPKEKSTKGIEGYYGIEGISNVKNQLKNNPQAITERIASTVLSEYDISEPSNLLYLAENNRVLTGDIFDAKYLKHFSIKFFTALNNINETVYGKKGNGLIFVYSNLVKVGIDIFQEVLQRNGYLEYQENSSSYVINKNTRCYFCEHTFDKHTNLPPDVPKHEFHPATYITFTGKSDDGMDQIPEEKHRILTTVFNTRANSGGKHIKIIIGSKVMNEGITLHNIKEIHILDVHFNLGKVDQVIGRGIRFCKHYDIITESSPWPAVEIIKYVVSLDNELSTEEEMYRKAEEKYKLIKKCERILQEEAIDCPLNRGGNLFPDELEKYKNCGTDDNPCPAICGYMPCEFKCGDKFLNAEYYDPNKIIYKKVANANLDYSTYSNSLAINEIDHAKYHIKEMYKLNHIYTLSDILKYVKKSYPVDKQSMFDEYYVYQGLSDLIPITGNDFNNFSDTITDKFNRPGYIIHRNKYYIFQPFIEDETLPMYYRSNYRPAITNSLSIKNFIKNTAEYSKYKENEAINSKNNSKDDISQAFNMFVYDFDSVFEYYDSRDEFDHVGIIDRESIKRAGAKSEIKDEFKIRKKRPKVLLKKREVGVPSFKGAVCSTSKDKQELIEISSKLGLNLEGETIRSNICDTIRDKLFDMEKYSTTKAKNKMTYIIVPANHPTIPFPLNLEDRLKLILNNIKQETRISINPKITVKTNKAAKRFDDIDYVSYIVEFDPSMNQYADILTKYGARKTGNKYVITVE